MKWIKYCGAVFFSMMVGVTTYGQDTANYTNSNADTMTGTYNNDGYTRGNGVYGNVNGQADSSRSEFSETASCDSLNLTACAFTKDSADVASDAYVTLPSADTVVKEKVKDDELKLKYGDDAKLKAKKDELKYKDTLGDAKLKIKKDEIKDKEADGSKAKIKKDELKEKFSDGAKVKDKKDELKDKEADGSKVKVKKDEVKDKEADGTKFKMKGDEVKVKDPDGSKIKEKGKVTKETLPDGTKIRTKRK